MRQPLPSREMATLPSQPTWCPRGPDVLRFELQKDHSRSSSDLRLYWGQGGGQESLGVDQCVSLGCRETNPKTLTHEGRQNKLEGSMKTVGRYREGGGDTKKAIKVTNIKIFCKRVLRRVRKQKLYCASFIPGTLHMLTQFILTDCDDDNNSRISFYN